MVMFRTNVADVKARLSEYLERAARGERILICRHNKPIAELRAADDTRTEPRPIGPLPGRPTFRLPESFFEPIPDGELEQWEGAGLAAPAPRRRPLRRDGVSRMAEARSGARKRARRS